jgi:hypothetical protein
MIKNQEENIEDEKLHLSNSPNTAWHLKHKLSNTPSLDERIKWHIEHARRCPCSIHDEDILNELYRRYKGTYKDFWILYNVNDHRNLGLWAAKCTQRLLPYLETKYPNENRPRNAINALLDWARSGKFCMENIRKASLDAHKVAKEVNKNDKDAIYVAHAAGQAVATAHVPTHAVGVVIYSILLFYTLYPLDFKNKFSKERKWQYEKLPSQLIPWLTFWVDKKTALIPKIRSLLV